MQIHKENVSTGFQVNWPIPFQTSPIRHDAQADAVMGPTWKQQPCQTACLMQVCTCLLRFVLSNSVDVHKLSASPWQWNLY